MKEIKWNTTTIAGSKFSEAVDVNTDKKVFDAYIMSSKIDLYDLRETPAKKYIFTDVKLMKKICEESLVDKTVLAPYLDTEIKPENKNIVQTLIKELQII